MPCRATEEAPGFGQVAKDKNKRKVKARVSVGVSAGKAKQGRENSLGLASLNNYGRIWAVRVISLSGTWLWDDLGQKKYWLMCESRIRRWLRPPAQDYLISTWKTCSWLEHFATCKKGLALGGELLSGQ